MWRHNLEIIIIPMIVCSPPPPPISHAINAAHHSTGNWVGLLISGNTGTYCNTRGQHPGVCPNGHFGLFWKFPCMLSPTSIYESYHHLINVISPSKNFLFQASTIPALSGRMASPDHITISSMLHHQLWICCSKLGPS